MGGRGASPRCVVLGRNLHSHDTRRQTLRSGAPSSLLPSVENPPPVQSTPRRALSPDLSSGSQCPGQGHPAGPLAASRPLNDSCRLELDSCVTSRAGRAAPPEGGWKRAMQAA